MLAETIEHANIIIKEGLDRDDDIQEILKKLLNLIQIQQAEIEKKDKIIDLMAEKISGYDFDFSDICKKRIIDCDKCEYKRNNCIRQYFEKKVEE